MKITFLSWRCCRYHPCMHASKPLPLEIVILLYGIYGLILELFSYFFIKKKTLINLLIIKQSRVNDVWKPIKEQTPFTNPTRTHKLLLCCLLRWPTWMAHLIVLFIWILLLHQYNSRIPFPNYSCGHDFVFK